MNKIPHVLRNVVGEARCRVFDWRHGVRTCGGAKLADLTIVGNNTDHGLGYYPSHPKFLFEVLGSLNIDYPSYTFVDVGSGKGRVLLVASEFPFFEVVGVEFATEMHEIACRNIQRYRSKTQKCKNVKSVNLDAIEYELPLKPFGRVASLNLRSVARRRLRRALYRWRRSMQSTGGALNLGWLTLTSGGGIVSQSRSKRQVHH